MLAAFLFTIFDKTNLIVMSEHKLLRPHNGQRDGEMIDLNEDQVNYFQRVGLIAEPSEDTQGGKESKKGLTTKEEKNPVKSNKKKK